jgi:hypothetical protein
MGEEPALRARYARVFTRYKQGPREGLADELFVIAEGYEAILEERLNPAVRIPWDMVPSIPDRFEYMAWYSAVLSSSRRRISASNCSRGRMARERLGYFACDLVHLARLGQDPQSEGENLT